MTVILNETHDPARRSFVESANAPGNDFPIQNLPFGVFRPAPGHAPRVGVAIGDQVLDVAAAAPSFTGLAAEAAAQACAKSSLNHLMSLGPAASSALRLALSRGLSAERGDTGLRRHLTAMAQAEVLLPVVIGDFTDFYASVFHATNAGRFFRPENPLLPNYKYIPVAYHGRSSSVRVSGTPVKRPKGQRNRRIRRRRRTVPRGTWISSWSSACISVRRVSLATPCRSAKPPNTYSDLLLNDWSARDVQAWEYQPLGPFLGKNFATTVSPWVVTQEAFVPFRIPAFVRPQGDTEPLPHLSDAEDHARGGFDITLEAYLATDAMRRAGMPPKRLTQTSFATTYWTFAQMVAHHTSNGCNLATGDLIGSGTVPARKNPAGEACSNSPHAAASRSSCRAANSAASSKTVTRSSFAASRRSPAIRASGSVNAARCCCRRSRWCLRRGCCALSLAGEDDAER